MQTEEDIVLEAAATSKRWIALRKDIRATYYEEQQQRDKKAIVSTCHKIPRHKNHHDHKEWITVDELNKIQERRNKKAAVSIGRTRAEKAKARAEFTEANKQVKKSIRTDKRKYVEDLAMTAEEAARE
ncbi:unnamed protein product [Schistosoma margrebowiei]|uniref:Uncharacterized protein n=1 Tax=Schistosoma margrebowiei TaxID=48269 RepID=A0A183LU50_9TREM|nr:unnamed protein product [Schistosoma margrebowiei]